MNKLLLLLCFAFFSLTLEARAANCTATIVSPVTFSNVNPLATGTYDTTSTLTITCSGVQQNQPVTACPDLGAGTGGSNTSSQRLLSGTGGTLPFQIFSDSGPHFSLGNGGKLRFKQRADDPDNGKWYRHPNDHALLPPLLRRQRDYARHVFVIFYPNGAL